MERFFLKSHLGRLARGRPSAAHKGTGVSTRRQQAHADHTCEPPRLPAAPAPQTPAWSRGPHLHHSRQHPRHRRQHGHVDHISTTPGSTRATDASMLTWTASPPLPAAPAPPRPLPLQPITGFVVAGKSLLRYTRNCSRVVATCGLGGAAQPAWVSAPSPFVPKPIQQLAAAASPLLAWSHSSGEES